jgi:hypothetical protein
LDVRLGSVENDDFVEIVLAYGVLDGDERVRTTDEVIDRPASRAAKERDGGLERPVGRLSVWGVRDQQGEPSWLALGAA